MATEFRIADYADDHDAECVVQLLDEYARDPIGGGAPLSDYSRANLVARLKEVSGAFSVLGFKDGAAVALANCFHAFSTFACRPLVNIHDLVITKAARGDGLSQSLLAFIEDVARRDGCCKVTLEVLERHHVARGAYTKFGFRPYELDETSGPAIFMHKVLD